MFSNLKKRGLAFLLSSGLVLSQFSVSIYGQTDDVNLCEHHTEHTSECGYTEGSTETPCAFLCNICNTEDNSKAVFPDEDQPEPTVSPQTANPVSDSTAVAPVSDMTRTTEHHFTIKHQDLLEWMSANNVQNGDTIILDAEPYVKSPASSDASPQIINKNVTIRAGKAKTIHFRSGGLILGANVFFDNVVLDFQNRIRNVIMANGHTLTLNNVTHDSGGREIHLLCGGLTGYQTTASTGTHGQIIIQGNTSLGNIYAGSLSSDGTTNTYSNNATITIDKNATGKMGKIYASGAKETFVNQDQMLDPYYTPDPPSANADQYFVTGNVTINLYDNVVRTVDGQTGGSANAKVTYNGNGYPNNTLILANIGGLFVQTSDLTPAAGSSISGNNAEISVAPDAQLSLVNLNKKLTTGNFSGGGTIILDATQTWTITGTVSGTTKIGIGEIWNNASKYIPKLNHTYISAINSNNASFQLIPHQQYPNQVFYRSDQGAWTVGTATPSSIKINSVSIPSDFPLSEKNNGAEIPVTINYSSSKQGMSSVPVTITVNDIPTTRSGNATDGFIYSASDLGIIEFTALDSGEILGITGTELLGQIAPGTYRIACTIPASYMSTNQDYTIRTTLTVAPSEFGSLKVLNGNKETTVFSYGDTITVQFTPASKSLNDKASSTGNDPAQNQTVLYYGDQPLTEPVMADSNGMFTLTHDTSRSNTIPASDFGSKNQKTLTVRYGGSDSQNGNSMDISITLTPKNVHAIVTNEITKPYDTSNSASVKLSINNTNYVRKNDSLTLMASGTYNNETAGINKPVTVTITSKSGNNHEAYNVIAPTNITGTIIKAETKAPQTPEFESRTANSITLKAIAPSSNGAAAEYSINNGQSWQADRTFTGLSSGTAYTFLARYQELTNYSASVPSKAAVFQTAQQEYSITILNNGNGKASSSSASAIVGTQITLTAIPDKGYHFERWEAVSSNVTIHGDSFFMPAGDVTIKAFFTKDSSQLDNGDDKLEGWHIENGKKYWYDNGIMARDKEVYDPKTDAWYWFDQDGTMATDKDVFIPTNDQRTEGKWVRYDADGGMIKGEDYRYGGWYWFDPITGEMIKDFVFIPENGTDGKWVYYDKINGQMHHGESCIDGNWYYFDDWTGKMIHGEYCKNDQWYYYDQITGIMTHGWVSLPNGERAYYDEITGIRK